MAWMTPPLPVIQREQLHRPDLEPRLLAGLALGGLAGGLADVGPADRKRPAAVVTFADQEDPPVGDDRRAHIDLGRRISTLGGEEILDDVGVGGGAGGSDLCRHPSDLAVALPIKWIAGVGQPSLA